MTLEEQIAVLQKAQSHYEHDCRKEEAMGNYTPVEKSNDFASKGVAGIGDTEIMLRMENIEEIANAARRME